MDTKDTSLLLAEYNALRNEIIKRMDFENQLTAFTIIVFGTILGIGFQSKATSLILLFPVLALFLSIGWSHSDARTMQMGAYISEHIESVVGTEYIGWEHYIAANRHSMYYWANKGIFLITELIAIFVAMLIGQSVKTFDLTTYALLSIAIASFLLTLVIILRPTLIKSRSANASKTHQVSQQRKLEQQRQVAEQFSLLKKAVKTSSIEKKAQYQTFEEAQSNIGQFIEDVYTTKRLHSSLGYVPPIEFEMAYRDCIIVCVNGQSLNN